MAMMQKFCSFQVFYHEKYDYWRAFLAIIYRLYLCTRFSITHFHAPHISEDDRKKSHPIYRSHTRFALLPLVAAVH